MNRTRAFGRTLFSSSLVAATFAGTLMCSAGAALGAQPESDTALKPKLVQLPNGRMALRTERVERRPRLASSSAMPGRSGSSGAGTGNTGSGGGTAASTELADWNGDGTVNSSDQLAYMVDYSARHPRADLDGNNAWNSSDALAFSNVYAAAQANGHDGFPVLQPGAGFGGATPVPPPVGNASAPGFDARAIARWNMVPYQTFDSTFNVGIVAFHINGIDRVEFSLDGGPWLPVTQMSLNLQSQTWEYVASIDPTAMADGRHEVRARVIPKVAGQARVLGGVLNDDSAHSGMHSMIVHTNGGRSLPMNVVAVSRHGSDATGNGSDSAPYRTITQAVRSVSSQGAGQANGMTVRIMSEGDWDVPSLDQVANDRWITIETSGSVSSDSVRFTMPGLPRADLLRFRGVTFVPSTSGSLVNPPRDYSRLLWLDRVHVAGTGRSAPTRGIFGNMMTYVTDSLFTDMPNGPTDILYVRNTRVERILSDAFSNTFMVVNSSVDDIDPLNSDAHPDVYQVYRPAKPMENVIVYGLNATDIVAQGIFFGGMPPTPHSNMAFANCVIAARSNGAGASQIGTSLNHVLLINVTLYHQALLWRARDLKDCGVLNSCIQKMGYDGSSVSLDELNTRVRFDSTHYIDATSYGALRLGADSSSGDPLFRNPAAWDLSPMSGSPLLGRGAPILPGDLNNSQRANPPSVGAYDASR